MSECNFYHGRGKQGRSCRGCGTYIPPLETTSVSEFTDTERLDWLMERQALPIMTPSPGYIIKYPFQEVPQIIRRTFREAIDSEMRREEESKS